MTNDLFSVQGKIALVTGGTAGIGAMIAEGLINAGATVYILGRDEEKGTAKAKELSPLGKCHFVSGDLSSVAGIQAIADKMQENTSKLDILVNNAGMLSQAFVDDVTEEIWDAPFDINLKAVFFMIQKLLPLLRAAGTIKEPARVVNIASVAGLSVDGLEMFSYAASKAGVIHLTKILAPKLAPDHITVNAIAPGIFPTDIGFEPPVEVHNAIVNAIPLKHLGEPENIMGAILFLVSKTGTYSTGSILTVDGGKSL